MTKDKTHRILDITDEIILWHEFEDVYMTIKPSNQQIYLGAIYSEPSCGLISTKNNWCLVGGTALILWTKKEIVGINDHDLQHIFDIRETSENKVELLIDPWADNSAIWGFDIITKEKNKIKDFIAFKGKAYTNRVVW
ncbi:hypothetical protein FAZ15_17400 [Sphingobacterium olei]|uniref:Uncharacterized protein n=1 Tax=Sphingobacterium olei TaxID=2571155 RepID=A0A4U0NHV2_9SPHI|nr:hypothetical protein [Sphingobacterium olei]TJZ53796.1 hypothetical protein FAZ15_17400 [Sphingobacterium olei]